VIVPVGAIPRGKFVQSILASHTSSTYVCIIQAIESINYLVGVHEEIGYALSQSIIYDDRLFFAAGVDSL
jgi:hypothetical protein